MERSVVLCSTPGGEEVRADVVISLPVMTGPALAGLPMDDDGFIPVDEHSRVTGAEDVYAAGDGTNFPLKQGGLATQQAELAFELFLQARNKVVSAYQEIMRMQM